MKDRIAFQAAMLIPNSDHAISSHRTTGAFNICLSRSSVLKPLIEPDVQVVGPSHHICSTPA